LFAFQDSAALSGGFVEAALAVEDDGDLGAGEGGDGVGFLAAAGHAEGVTGAEGPIEELGVAVGGDGGGGAELESALKRAFGAGDIPIDEELDGAEGGVGGVEVGVETEGGLGGVAGAVDEVFFGDGEGSHGEEGLRDAGMGGGGVGVGGDGFLELTEGAGGFDGRGFLEEMPADEGSRFGWRRGGGTGEGVPGGGGGEEEAEGGEEVGGALGARLGRNWG